MCDVCPAFCLHESYDEFNLKPFPPVWYTEQNSPSIHSSIIPTSVKMFS